MAIALRTHHGSGYIPSQDLKTAEEILLSDVKIDRSHDVPFCAGMSEDGKTLYVDKDVPENVDGMDITKALVVHEMIEHLLMDQVGLPYDEAHFLATAAELACVRANGWDTSRYNACWDKIIRKVAARGQYPNIPDDLDTEPYEDDGDDKEREAVDHSRGFLGGKAYLC